MPIKIGKKTFQVFQQAVEYIQHTRGVSQERAGVIAAEIDRRQNGGNKRQRPKKGH